MTSITITADSGEQYVQDTDYPEGWHAAEAWVSTTDPNHRVIIERQDWDYEGPWGWDTLFRCYWRKGHDDKPMFHNSVHVWNESHDGALPKQQVLLGIYTTVHDLDDDELAEYLPTDGTLIGLDYNPGHSVSVNDSPDPRDWDGYFHITERHWLDLLSADPAGRTYTSREARARALLTQTCACATAWINGEIYAWSLQHREQWTNDRTGATRSEWETVEGCGGYYAVGERWHTDMVIEAFDARPSMDPAEVAA